MSIKNTQDLVKKHTSRGYQKVRFAVENYIQTNGLQPGDRIPTEAEFCRLLGWSRPTITRALNDMASEGLLERIQGSGTFVSEPKRSSNGISSIMVSTPWTEPGSYVNPLFAGIRQEAARQSFSVTYYTESAVPSPDIVKEYGVDGVLAVAPWLDNLPAIHKLKEANIPVVGLAIRNRVGDIHVVCTDNYGGMYDAAKYLYRIGHRKIAYVSDGITNSDVFERLLGLQNALAEEGLLIDPSYLLIGSLDINQSYFEYWFDNLPSLPTAMLFSIKMAIPVLLMMANKQIRIPDDISLVVTDDTEKEWGLGPNLTCIHQPIFEMGCKGVAMLLSIITGEHTYYQEVIPTRLILGDSVAPPRG